MKNLLLIAIAILGFSAASFGQTSATSLDVPASATIILPLQITKTTSLSFGTIGALTSGASNVIMDTNGLRTGTATSYSFASNPATAAEFAIVGTPNASFAITLPSTITDLTGPGTKMTIAAGATGWIHNLGSTPKLSTSGTETLKVGATLLVGQSQAPGDYSGKFDITINYN